MGTRALTKIYDERGQHIVTMYRQFDGYPEEHGLQLGEFLSERKLINGISMGRGESESNSANGMGCLAAQVVAHFKNEAGLGGIYLFRERETDHEDFTYEIRVKNDEYHITVHNWKKKVFEGDIDHFLAFCNGENIGDEEEEEDK